MIIAKVSLIVKKKLSVFKLVFLHLQIMSIEARLVTCSTSLLISQVNVTHTATNCTFTLQTVQQCLCIYPHAILIITNSYKLNWALVAKTCAEICGKYEIWPNFTLFPHFISFSDVFHDRKTNIQTSMFFMMFGNLFTCIYDMNHHSILEQVPPVWNPAIKNMSVFLETPECVLLQKSDNL